MTVPHLVRIAALAAVSLGVALPMAGQTPVSVTFQGPDPTSPVIYSVYAGFYDELWNGGPWHNANVKVVTDDFYDSVGGGQTWNANVYSATALATNPSLGLFGNQIGVQGYAEVAALVMAMYTIPAGSGSVFGQAGISQADISAAIWFITGDGVSFSGLTSAQQFLVTHVDSLYGGNATAAAAYLSHLTNLWISVPASYANGTLPPNENGEEDWLLTVPEGGTALLYLLLASGVCFGAIRSGCRGRLSASPGC